MAIRRKLITGPILDLTYGFDLSDPKEWKRWFTYARDYKPRVLIMGPPCTQFGPLSNCNSKYPDLQEKLNHSIELANFAAKLAMLQLNSCHDFIAEMPQTSTQSFRQSFGQI